MIDKKKETVSAVLQNLAVLLKVVELSDFEPRLEVGLEVTLHRIGDKNKKK